MSEHANPLTPHFFRHLSRCPRSIGLALVMAVAGLAAAPGDSGAAEPKADGDEAAEEDPSVEVIFTGFARRSDQGARVFVHLTGEVPVEAQRDGNTLRYRMNGAKLGGTNNANPLPTRHFGPPVSRVSLVSGDGSVDLLIELSGDSTATHEVKSRGNLATLLVELPPRSK